MKYKFGTDKNEKVLFPEAIADYIDEQHLVRFIDIIIEKLDFSELDEKYASLGQRAYNPRTLTSVIFYGYSIGLFSSRRLEDACFNRMDFRFLTNNLFPSYKTISEFRRSNLDFLKKQFTEIVLIGIKMGAVSIGNIKVSIDGTKMKANASSKKTKNLDHLEKLMKKTESDIKQLMNKSETIDSKEDTEVGDSTQRKISEKVMRRESSIKSIQEAISALKTKIELDKKVAAEKKGKELSKWEVSKIEKQKINITDHDAKFMKDREGCIRSNYNGQISVTENNQFIIASDVTSSPADYSQLQNMINKSEKNIDGKVNQVKADSGYENKNNLKFMEEHGAEFFIDSRYRSMSDTEKYKFHKVNFCYNSDKDHYVCPTGKIIPFYNLGFARGVSMRKYKCINSDECPEKKECCSRQIKVIDRYPDDYLLENNLTRMLDPEIREEYNTRKHTVEPVFGDLKHNRKFRHFLLRGIEKVKGEFSILCISFNLRKLHKIWVSKT